MMMSIFGRSGVSFFSVLILVHQRWNQKFSDAWLGTHNFSLTKKTCASSDILLGNDFFVTDDLCSEYDDLSTMANCITTTKTTTLRSILYFYSVVFLLVMDVIPKDTPQDEAKAKAQAIPSHPAQAKMQQLLGKKLKCTLSDGRTATGTFICMDRL